MLNWLDVINFTKLGKLPIKRRVEKTEAEWAALLDPDVFRITRKHGTERPHSGALCQSFEPGVYACACCKVPLFDSREKFESGSGWPSFTQPISKWSINHIRDTSHSMDRIEAQCSTCDAHLGHVFPDGPMPSGLRYCINSLSMEKMKSTVLEVATFGGGCFWCTEAIFNALEGVESVESGYSGGKSHNPSYQEVCSGTSGHAEVIQVMFDPSKISFEDLLRVHLHTHNPTTLNRQGADKGTQYRSVVFYHNDAQKEASAHVIAEEQADFEQPIVTEVSPMTTFYKAEAYHQGYYNRNQYAPYCSGVISPKLKKLREKYADKLKGATQNAE